MSQEMLKIPASVIAPMAKKKPHQIEKHGDVRTDDYFWLREKENPEVINLLKAENAYTEEVLKPVKQLREDLFQEMKARIKEDDSEVPSKKDNYFYYTRMETGKQYAFYCRKHGSLTEDEEILLDCNKLAEGQKYFSLGNFEVSPDHKWLAYTVDSDGGEKYTLHFKNLTTGENLTETISNLAHSIEWANDNKTVFYTVLDENLRPDRVFKHRIGDDPKNDPLIYKEHDSQFFVFLSKSLSDQYLFIDISGKVTSEVHFLDANQPDGKFQVMEPRRHGILYDATHHENRFLIVTNDKIQNFRLVESPVNAPGAQNWKEILSGTESVYIQSVEAFRSHLVIWQRADGLMQLKVMDLKNSTDHLISFPEPTYTLFPKSNPEYGTEVFRFAYNSMVTPTTVYDYNMSTRAREVKKTQEIPSGYDKSQYRSERIFATAKDGKRVPISIVYKLDQNGQFNKDSSHPLYLYGYGSYGMSMPATFSTSRLSLLDRGFVFAIAHIRGGADMGRQWYDDGKFLKKMNTFTDFISCAEHLIQEKFTSKGNIAIVGGSAGGMLIGTVLNLRPDLFKAAAAHVPFVDVVNTMLDNTLPLTTFEYEEWGNPDDPTYYHYMKSYSPYDNLKAQDYPHLLVTSGLNDPRVTYWEPAKWVARLREIKTDKNLLLQHISMEAGHGGPSGRYEHLKETALEYAFLFMVYGKV